MGHIFGLSDAILGLTVFAMGNSLGDLVANATVAVRRLPLPRPKSVPKLTPSSSLPPANGLPSKSSSSYFLFLHS